MASPPRPHHKPAAEMTFIMPTDPGYGRAKRIKQGVVRLDPIYDRFVDRFHARYGIPLLTIGLDSIDRPGGEGKTPRVAVVLERSLQYRAFLTSPFNYDKAKQKEIARLLTTAVPARTLRESFDLPHKRLGSAPKAEDIFVCFQDFEDVAKHEVHDLAVDSELKQFESSLGIGDQFWCTQRFTGPPIVFVHTDAQAQALRASPVRDTWADTYYEIAKRYDEFGYLDRAEIAIMVDSEENFETNYASNWYYYFK
jgi:hypothetical protein